MKIKIEQLSKSLETLAPVYLIVGEETLLVEESRKLIKEAAKEHQFDEQQTFMVETGFDWENFYGVCHSFSLFSNRVLIELRFKNSPNAQAQQALTTYLSKAHPDKLLVITIPKLEKSAAAHANFKTIEKNGVWVQVWPIAPAYLPAWIRTRLKKQGLDASEEALQFIALQVEGNLLAASQEVEKLALLYQAPTRLTFEQAVHALHDNARFDVFSLVDTVLMGNLKQSLRVLDSLREEGIEATLILWALAREIRLLWGIQEEVARGQSMEALWGKYRVWEKRQPVVRAALRRHNISSLSRSLRQAAQIDRVIKSNQASTVWHEFSKLICQLVQPEVLGDGRN